MLVTILYINTNWFFFSLFFCFEMLTTSIAILTLLRQTRYNLFVVAMTSRFAIGWIHLMNIIDWHLLPQNDLNNLLKFDKKQQPVIL